MRVVFLTFVSYCEPSPQIAQINSIVIVPMMRMSLSAPSTMITPPYSNIMSCTAWEKPTTLREQSIALAMAKMMPIDPPNSGPKILDLFLENINKFISLD